MKVNVNNSVVVILTEAGMVVLRKYYENLDNLAGFYLGLPSSLNLETREYKTQLWDLMHIFGPQMWNGNPDVMFENNCISIA